MLLKLALFDASSTKLDNFTVPVKLEKVCIHK